MQSKMAEDINIAKKVNKSKGKRQSSREKGRPLKKQKVGLSVGKSSEKGYCEGNGIWASEAAPNSVTGLWENSILLQAL
ncbi:hypothetical protein V2J09_021378 [Rumex salicifolius]